MKYQKPARCLTCRKFWTGGRKNGRHDRWCVKFGNVAAKVQAQCIQSSAKEAA
jgi:hypothetical protein